MADATATTGALTVKAYRGDAKTLLAFDLTEPQARTGLAGFTVQVTPPGVAPYFLTNSLTFEHPEDHAQDPSEPPTSTVNAPLHAFRWVHHPGLVHQGLTPTFGTYAYAVTPRWFDGAGHLLALDASKTATVEITVDRFRKGAVSVGFTRGFVQSQAFVRHFGKDASLPDFTGDLEWAAQTPPPGVEPYTLEDQCAWLGYTAREQVYALLDEVVADASLSVDVFAYDLDEPTVIGRLLQLGQEGRARVILDDATLHTTVPATDGKPAKVAPEDTFATKFVAVAGADRLQRGKFTRFAHDKVMVVSRAGAPEKVLTGSTNFSCTGLYVNANHVLVFDDTSVAALYAAVFQAAWDGKVAAAPFLASDLSHVPVPDTAEHPAGTFASGAPCALSITFSPHSKPVAADLLGAVVADIDAQAGPAAAGRGSVLFAVMSTSTKDNPVYDALNTLHANTDVFSYGISDSPDEVALYEPGQRTGVFATGKPADVVLPPPFSQVPKIANHEIHHKFVVCGFNGADPVVWCGSSNLALGGEHENGDNLLRISDGDLATVFTIEALTLVDHYLFLDRLSTKGAAAGKAPGGHPPADKAKAAQAVGWHLSTDDAWAARFFDPADLRCADRELFAG